MFYLPLIREALVELNFKASLNSICDVVSRLEPNVEESSRREILAILKARSNESDSHKIFRKLSIDQNHLWELIVCPTDFTKEILKKLAYDFERDDYKEAFQRINCFADEIIEYLSEDQVESFHRNCFKESNNIWQSNGLKLYKAYERNDVREIFDPNSPKGRWQVPSYINLNKDNHKIGAVFFSTVGAQQAGIKFNDTIDINEGTFTWDCQPSQNIDSEDIQSMINSSRGDLFYLFYRPNKNRKYTHMGRLKYLSHELNTRLGTAVAIKWKLLDYIADNNL